MADDLVLTPIEVGRILRVSDVTVRRMITRGINDEGWLQMVRQDLDSKAEDWAVKTKVGDIGKLEAVCHYLDAILTELDWPSSIHDCPMCGNRHRGDGLRSDAPPKASK